MADVGRIRATIELNTAGFTQGMNNARGELSKFSTSTANVKRDLNGIQKASTVVAGAIAGVVGASVGQAATLEKTLSKVQAVTNATEEDMQRMKKAALDYGASTAFSATQVGDSLVFLGQAGLDVNESLDALPSVLSLAAAGGIGLADSANYVTNIMSGFKIEADETAKVVDILAKAASTANTDVPGMAEAFKMAGPVAASLGFTIEETAAAIGELANIGISGSQAGTVLRASMLSLANPVGQAEKAMEKYGISVLDANGNMKPLPELIGHVGEQLDGMTDAQKTAAAAQLVGVEAASGFIGLLNVGEEGLRNYTTELENAGGTAERMADTQMDNLAGSFEEFQGALETVGIKIGDEFLPVFRDMIDAGADIVRWIGDFDGESIKLTLSFVGITAAVAATLATVGKLSIALSAFALTPVGAAIVGISLLAGVVGTAAMASDDMKEVTFETTDALLAEQEALNSSVARYDELKESMDLTTGELQRFVDINALMKQTTDPEVLTRLKDEQNALLEKSTLTNDEFTEFLGLNEELIAVMPNATTTISDQGYALLDSTEAAKGMNAEMVRKIELELEAQLAVAQSNEADNLRKQKSLQEEINGLSENKIALDETITEASRRINELQREYADAKAAGDDREASRLENKISQQEAVIEGAKAEKAEEAELIIKKMEELDLTNEQLGKLQEAKDRMKQLALAQVGINAEKGQELEALDSAKAKLQEEKRQLERNTPAAAQNTQEYREAVGAIDEQIRNLGVAKSKVTEITGAANLMNASLGKSIYKNVYVKTHGAGGGVTREVNHSGGIAGAKTPPKLHTGGFGFDAVKDTLSAPMQHEVDVRMLRNEMVLTESQQANLMRMIDAGHSQGDAGQAFDPAIATLLGQIAQNTAAGKNVRVVLSDDALFESTQGKLVDEISTKRFTGGYRD